MFEILRKEVLNPTMILMEIRATLTSKKAKPGQFVIVRAFDDSERLPFTIAGSDEKRESITIIYQIVGAGTIELNRLNEGDRVHDLVGPLGKPSELEGLKRVAVVGGGAGCAIAYPLAQALHAQKSEVVSICGFRSQDLVILEKEFESCSDTFIKMSDDGSWGRKGFVTAGLEEEILNRQGTERQFEEVIAIGPLVMMKNIAILTKKYGIHCVVSMNPIMIDGTGMCGCCRLTVGGKTKFACVDGPDFDGWEVDFDSAMERNTMYKEWERKKYSNECNLFKGAK